MDRRFNRARYDADQMIAGFAAQLKDTVDLDSVRDDLAGVVNQALEPAHVSVWIKRSRVMPGFGGPVSWTTDAGILRAARSSGQCGE